MRSIQQTSLTALAVLALAGLLAGCGAESTSGTSPAPATSAAGTTPSPTSPTEPGGRMTEGISQPVVLVRTGGIGGLKDRLELRPDGTYTVTSKGKEPVTRQLGERQLAAIVDALQRADLPTLANQSPTERRSDQFSYTLMAEGTTFTTTDTTAPDAVRPLLQQLGALFSAPAPTP